MRPKGCPDCYYPATKDGTCPLHPDVQVRKFDHFYKRWGAPRPCTKCCEEGKRDHPKWSPAKSSYAAITPDGKCPLHLDVQLHEFMHVTGHWEVRYDTCPRCTTGSCNPVQMASKRDAVTGNEKTSADALPAANGSYACAGGETSSSGAAVTGRTTNNDDDGTIFDVSLAVPPPLNGIVYEKKEAIANIRHFPKFTKFRSEAINFMLREGYIASNRTEAYDIVKQAESEEHQQLQSPNSCPDVVDMADLGLGYDGYFIPKSCRDNVEWRGKIILSLRPVTHEMSIGRTPAPEYAASTVNKTSPILIDICQILGNSDVMETNYPVQLREEENFSPWPRYENVCQRYGIKPMKYRSSGGMIGDRNRIARLYFSPSDYPPPKSEGAKGLVFATLKEYIEQQSKLCGSPVVCNGGKNANERRFKCQKWQRRSRDINQREQEERRPYAEYSCSLTFVVKWDNAGFYIPLLKSPGCMHNNGCGWHCCYESFK